MGVLKSSLISYLHDLNYHRSSPSSILTKIATFNIKFSSAYLGAHNVYMVELL